MKTNNAKGRNIGRGASILALHIASEEALHDDADAWNAPSECHQLISVSSARRFRTVRKRIKAVTGLKFHTFLREVKRRTSSRWIHFNLPG